MLQQKFVDLFARGSDVALPVAERDVVLTELIVNCERLIVNCE